MYELEQTAHALSELRSSDATGFGMHMSDQVKFGGRGIFVGDSRWDPASQPASMINANSALGRLTGWPQVPMRIPDNPVEMSVIIHDDSGDHANPESVSAITQYKYGIAQGVHKAIQRAAHLGDELSVYVVGNQQIEINMVEKLAS
ncbi:MAG: hypothetical protein WDN66_00310 [Candidatus Saccharibacteria bacterium]